jgi:hypothetical protein
LYLQKCSAARVTSFSFFGRTIYNAFNERQLKELHMSTVNRFLDLVEANRQREEARMHDKRKKRYIIGGIIATLAAASQLRKH